MNQSSFTGSVKGSVMDLAAHDSESSGAVADRERSLGLFMAAEPCHKASTKSEIDATLPLQTRRSSGGICSQAFYLRLALDGYALK